MNPVPVSLTAQQSSAERVRFRISLNLARFVYDSACSDAEIDSIELGECMSRAISEYYCSYNWRKRYNYCSRLRSVVPEK